jgi:hypothetical protein
LGQKIVSWANIYHMEGFGDLMSGNSGYKTMENCLSPLAAGVWQSDSPGILKTQQPEASSERPAAEFTTEMSCAP